MPRASRSGPGNTKFIHLFSFQAYGPDYRSEPVFLRQLKLRDAEALVQEGKACFVYEDAADGAVYLKGVRLRELATTARSSPASLDAQTAQCAAGVGLKRPHELSSHHLRRREAAAAGKAMVWPLISDTRAPLVAPRVTAAQRSAGELYLRSQDEDAGKVAAR